MSDLDELEELANMVQNMALCGLGKSAPLPVISTLKRFRNEYEEHIRDKKCRAKVCTALRQFHINPEFCIGCGKCERTVRQVRSQVRLNIHITLITTSVSNAVHVRTTV